MNSQTIEQQIAREAAQREADERVIRAEIADKGRNEQRENFLHMALWERDNGQEFHIGGMFRGVQDVYGLHLYFYRYGFEITRDNKLRSTVRAAVRKVTRR